MTWERRRKTSSGYFYRAKRVGGRIDKQYGGSLADPVTAILARHERLSKAELRAEREAFADEKRVYAAIETELKALQRQVRRAVSLWEACPICCCTVTKGKGLAMQNAARRQPLSRDEFDELVKRAELEDAEALAELRALMRADPATWRQFGDLTEHVKRIFFSLMVQGDIVARESLSLQFDELTKELQRGHGSAIRKLVIDQILLLWLDVHYQQSMIAQPTGSKLDTDFLDRRLDKARKRYFAAIESLGRLDRILGPSPP